MTTGVALSFVESEWLSCTRTLYTLSDEAHHRRMAATVSAPARLRARNQLTIPEPIVEAAGIELGETFVVEVDPNDPDVVRLRRVRVSYAGALRGVYGDIDAYLEEERAAWGDA